MKILITSGGTEEPIDGVRFISNFSSGKTGAVISDHFLNSGAEVVLLKAKRAFSPENDLRMIEFTSFNDLNEKMKKLLSSESFDAVIHLAAVSDFSIDYIESGGKRLANTTGKIGSSKPLSIHLKPNFKILDHIKEYSKTGLLTIGFKLTNGEVQDKIIEKILKMFKKKTVDIIVHNDLKNISENLHPADIFIRNKLKKSTKTKRELAEALFKIINTNKNTNDIGSAKSSSK